MRRKGILVWLGICLLAVGLLGCPQAIKNEFNFVQGDLQVAKGNYEEGIVLLRQYVAQRPDSARARSQLGFALMKTGRLDEAEKELTAALQIEPGNPKAVLSLGLTYLNQERPGKALEVLKGYSDKDAPQIEAEIKRQVTLILVAHSRQIAVKALAEEKRQRGDQPVPNTVAVCYYKDLSPDSKMRAYQKGLAAMVISDLSKISSIRVLERLRLQALLEEIKLGQTGIVDKRTAPRVGRLMAVENVVVGSLSPGSILVATAVDGRHSGTATAAVEEKNFFQLPMLITRDVAKILGLVLTPQQQSALGVPHTKNFKAFIYYGQGLDALDRGDWTTAQKLFSEALKLDPRFDLAAEALASTPNPDAPPLSRLVLMTGPQLADQLETALRDAQTRQKEIDLFNVGDERGGKEGDGGGGGGGGGGGH